MANVAQGVVAGFVATIVLSALMVIKSAMGIMPGLDVISMLSGMMGSAESLGWLAHFMIGSVLWGGLFAVVSPALPGESLWLKGVSFGVGAWLMMMIAVMPMAGAGFFGAKLGLAAPIMTLILHIIFGAILGGVYSALEGRQHRQRHAH